MVTVKRIALALIIIGALNWGLIALFQFDLVAAIFGGEQGAALARVVYTLVGLSGLYCIKMLFEDTTEKSHNREQTIRKRNLSYRTEFAEEDDLSQFTKDKEKKDE